jgi:hypothetical protein
MRRWLLALLLGLAAACHAPLAHAQTPVTLAWDASANAATYTVAWGSTSGHYTIQQAVGNVTQATITLATVPAYIAVNASDASGTSPYSTEVVFPVPQTDPLCTAVTGADAISIFPTAIMYTGSGGAGSRLRVDFTALSPGSPITHLALQALGANFSATDGTADGTNIGSLAGLWATIPTPSGSYPLTITATNAHGCVQTQATAYTVVVN